MSMCCSTLTSGFVTRVSNVFVFFSITRKCHKTTIFSLSKTSFRFCSDNKSAEVFPCSFEKIIKKFLRVENFFYIFSYTILTKVLKLEWLIYLTHHLKNSTNADMFVSFFCYFSVHASYLLFHCFKI